MERSTTCCQLCARNVDKTTRHHLIPRTLHSNKWFKKNYSRSELHAVADLCSDCHKQIHKLIPEKEMGRFYNTIDLLQENEKVSNYLVWIKKKQA